MGFRNRTLRLGLLTVLLAASTAIPGAWNTQAPGNAIGPSLVWAGGTPDETLHPQPNPPAKSRRITDVTLSRTETAQPAGSEVRATSAVSLTVRERLIAIWTMVRAMSLRN